MKLRVACKARYNVAGVCRSITVSDHGMIFNIVDGARSGRVATRTVRLSRAEYGTFRYRSIWNRRLILFFFSSSFPSRPSIIYS